MCQKVRYNTRVEAEAIVWRSKLKFWRGNTNRREARAYPCRLCRGWHITSREKDMFAVLSHT
jgi:hypothetical protein